MLRFVDFPSKVTGHVPSPCSALQDFIKNVYISASQLSVTGKFHEYLRPTKTKPFASEAIFSKHFGMMYNQQIHHIFPGQYCKLFVFGWTCYKFNNAQSEIFLEFLLLNLQNC